MSSSEELLRKVQGRLSMEAELYCKVLSELKAHPLPREDSSLEDYVAALRVSVRAVAEATAETSSHCVSSSATIHLLRITSGAAAGWFMAKQSLPRDQLPASAGLDQWHALHSRAARKRIPEET